MKQLRSLFAVLTIAAALIACGSLTPASAPTVDLATAVAATLQALVLPTAASAPEQPAPTQAAVTGGPGAGTPVSFSGVSFTAPTSVASGATTETVAAVNDQGGAPWEVAPAFSRFTLQGYPLQDKFWQPQIMVYPAQEYAAAGAGAANSIQRLQTILASPAPALSNDLLPRLPFANAEQLIGAQPLVLTFQGGSGLRVLAEYAQFNAPINNHDLFYHFEGLTRDGRWYIVATLPVNTTFLAAASDPAAVIPPDGVPFPGANTTDASVFTSYYQTMINRLSTTTPESFQPSLAALDTMFESFQFAP